MEINRISRLRYICLISVVLIMITGSSLAQQMSSNGYIISRDVISSGGGTSGSGSYNNLGVIGQASPVGIFGGNGSNQILLSGFLYPTVLGPGEVITSVGQNISVTPTPNVSLTFDSVTDSGITSVINQSVPALPTNFRVITGNSYQITTTATYSGNIQVCLSYDDAALADKNNEANIKLFHHNGQNWEDITVPPVDTINNVVCGITDTLSPFAVGEPVDTDLDGIIDIDDNCPTIANANQSNFDGDALGDACDTDDDNDGMSDGFELAYGFHPFDSLDASEDADLDGLTNLDEFNLGTNPLSPDNPNNSHPFVVTVVGEGAVHNTPGVDMQCIDDCSQVFVEGQTVILTAVPATNYEFTGWSGDCSGSGNCTLTMDTAKSVTANFTYIDQSKAVRLESSGVTYDSIQGAYDMAPTDQAEEVVIKVKAGELLEYLDFNRDVIVRLEGGYDPTFSFIESETILNGSLTIWGLGDTIIIDRLTIK